MSKIRRVGLSNKIRFELFKRDSFKCQYCGRCAPDIILNADHIIPIAEGGDNSLLNLVTSCFECNNGKSDRKLSDNSVVSKQRKQLEELSQRREQIDMLIAWKKLISDKSYEIDSIIKYFNDKNNCDISLIEFGLNNLKILLKKYTFENIIDAINAANEKYQGLDVIEIWDKLPSVLGFITATDEDRAKMKLFGGIKGRFNATSGYTQWNIIYTNKLIRNLFTIIDSGDFNLTYNDLFTILNRNDTYKYFQEDIQDLHNDYYQH